MSFLSRRRVVSLVPSVTESLLSWGVTPVAVTRFCEQPHLPAVGGTKDPDVERIISLRPDLVVMCEEENRREDHDVLRAAGVRTLVLDPRTVEGAVAEIARLAKVLELPSSPNVVPALPARPDPLGVTAFVPIWRRPWMSLGSDTYGSAVLDWLGVANVVAGSADRYPEVDLDAVRAMAPDVVLAPTEPYPFKDRHLDELSFVAPAALVDGQDLFWWGVRTPAALGRLHRGIAQAVGV